MKAGIWILLGLLLWLVARTLSGFLWVHQIKLSAIALLISAVSIAVWLTKQENRNSLRAMFKVKSIYDFPEFLANGGFAVNSVAVFFTILTLAQAVDIYIVHTDAYKQVEQAILSDSTVYSEVGPIKLIALSSFSHKAHRKQESFFAVLKVFGEQGKVTVRADASSYEGSWSIVLEAEE